MTGAPEDVIVSGAIAQAFEGRQIRFHAEERTFRWLTGDRGFAGIEGRGLKADMAKAVLEREGYEVVADQPHAFTVRIDDAGWRVSTNGTSVRGDTFRSLAAQLRAFPQDHGKENEG